MLQKLSLKDMPTFQHLKNACTALNLTGCIDMDGLCDEFSSSKEALQHIIKRDKEFDRQRWHEFFKSVKYVLDVGSDSKPINQNLFQLALFVLSLPASNAFPERIFSLMTSKWRSDRNRKSVSWIMHNFKFLLTMGLTVELFIQ